MDPATRDHAETLLLKAARAYRLQATRDEIQSAIDDPQHGTAFAEWATTHLISDCLLSVDEFASYVELDRSGHVDRLAAAHDLAEVQPVDEGDLRLAIQELEQSTQRISLQTKTLRQQQESLSRLVSRELENEAKRRRLADDRHPKAEHKQITIEIEELSRDVAFKLSDVELQCRDALPKINEFVGDLLESDDRLLGSLQKLGCELHQPNSDEQQMERLRQACSRLVKATVETVRIKLDTVYLDSLITAERSGHANDATVDEVRAYEEELESLYSEIPSVSHMSVERQHLEPAVKAITARTRNSLSRTTEALGYVNDCLDYLMDRMARLRTHIATNQSHQAASLAVASLAKAEISLIASAGTPASPRRPLPRRASSNNRRTSLTLRQDPMEALFELTVPSLSAEEPKRRAGLLAAALKDRSHKAAEVTRGAQDALETSVVSQMLDTKLAIQLLRDSVLAESPFGEVQLLDPELEDSILVLDQEVEKAKERLDATRKLNFAARSEKREDLLRRFG